MIEAGLLAAVVALLAAVSTAVGPAGGVVFAIMALILPPTAVVPVHAALQMGGNAIRSVALRPFVDRRAVAVFVVSGSVGALPAALLVSRLQMDEDWMRFALGVATLAPVLITVGQAAITSRHRKFVVAGVAASTSFLAIFVGATGALVAAVFGRLYNSQRDLMATQTTCLCFQHVTKIAVYGALGFSYRRYLPLLGGLLVASTVGTIVGRRVLVRADNRALAASFQILLLGLGVFLVVTSAMTIRHRAVS